MGINLQNYTFFAYYQFFFIVALQLTGFLEKEAPDRPKKLPSGSLPD